MKQFNYFIAFLLLTLFSTNVFAQEEQPDTLMLQEVIVSGYFEGLSKALDQKKNNVNITNVVTADQAGKFPDDNVGDALKRISGISVQNDLGEARNIVARGFGTQLNSVTLNGDRLPSAEGDNRNIQLDLIPTNMIESIEVRKTLTPDMEADAIGASVNLVTRSNPRGFRASATFSGGGNPIRNGGSNSNIAFVLSDNVSDKLSYSLSGTIQTKDYGSDNIEFAWNDPNDWSDPDKGEIEEMDIRRYDVKRTRRSVSMNLDYNINDKNYLYFKSIYNHRDDWENRYRFRAIYEDQELTIRKQTKGGIDNDKNDSKRLEDQKLYKIGFGGEHKIGALDFDWKYSYSKASEDRPNERYTRFQYDPVPYVGTTPWDISNLERPYLNFADNSWDETSSYEYKKTEEAQKYTEEDKNKFKLNFELPYGETSTLKFGGAFKDQSKMRDDIWYEYDMDLGNLNTVPTFNASINSYDPGSKYVLGDFMTPEYLGGFSLNGENDPNFDSFVMDEFAGANYTSKEQISAGYLMTTNSFGDKIKLIAGFRIENTSIDYVGEIFDEEEDETPEDVEKIPGEKKYSNFLPNLNLQYNFTNSLVGSVAFTQSIARPDYFDIVPYQYSNSDDREVEFGNPDLEATLSNNIDVMIDKYFGTTGLISLGLFSKTMDNWIYTYTTDNYSYAGESYDFTQKRNGESASVFGVEFILQTQLIDNVNLAANYTFTDSSTDNVEGRNDVPLVGAVENMYNISLAYETDLFFLRASYNYAGEQLDKLGGEAWEDRYYDEQKFLDINASFQLTEKVRLFAEAKNLTNQPLRYYQGIKAKTMQLEYYDLSWNVGLKFDF